MLSLTFLRVVNMCHWVRFAWGLAFVGILPLGAATLIPENATWRYRPGESAPSTPRDAWTEPGFADAAWESGSAPFRYGDGQGGTVIGGMRNNYSTFFIRRGFQIEAVDQIEGLDLEMDYDDGFILWINGVQVLNANGPATPALDAFARANHESGSAESFALNEALPHLRDGANVIAIQGFNVNLTSSDFMLHPVLTSRGVDLVAPRVVSVDPAPGNVGELERVLVTFSEPVQGLQAGDLALNGVPARGLRPVGDGYEFRFDPPEPGAVTLHWVQNPGITDLAGNPNPFDWQAESERREYRVVDASAPFITRQYPPAGLVLSKLGEIQVYFSEPVQGVDAEDLQVNGQAASAVAGVGAGPYQFTLPELAAGSLEIRWREGHGITDFAPEPNPYQESDWSYEIDPSRDHSGVWISEIMAGNQSGLFDDEGDRVDWIEIHNSQSTPVNLRGWALSDDRDESGKWVFDDFEIGPGEYRLVFASAKDRPSLRANGAPHTNFRLSRAGEYLALNSPELPRSTVSELGRRFPAQRNDHSYGVTEDGTLAYFVEPTPGAPNSRESVAEILPAPRFSAPRGFYNQSFELAITSRVPDAIIRYTTDGSEPTLDTGILYERPFQITRSRVIRAAAFKQGYLPSKTLTHTYIYRASAARRSLPVLSLVTDRDHLFGSRGIMETSPRNTNKRGRAWERPVSAELIRPEDNSGFQIDCGLRIQGGNYVRDRYNPNGSLPFSKYSYRLYFRGDYGESELDFPLIPRADVDGYKQIVLRAGMNDHSNPFVVDELVRRLSRDMGQISSQGTLVNLFVNGVYEGYYNPTERIDEDFLDTWTGGQGDYDVIAQFGEVRSGDTIQWNQLKTRMNRDLSVSANYRAVESMFDIDNFIDYILLNIYVGTRDWPHNNWRAARERVDGAKWRFLVWDAEWSFFNVGGSVTRNTINNELASNTDIARFYRALVANPEFRTRFADRAYFHFFEGGALTDENVSQRFEELRVEMSGVLRNMQTTISRTWIPRRREVVFSHLANAGLFLADSVPQFSQAPGSVPSGMLSIEGGEGVVYYTTDGSDPYLAQSGASTLRQMISDRTVRRVLVPTDDSLGSRWYTDGNEFDDSDWTTGRGGVGYDQAETYDNLIVTDLSNTMEGKNTSVYVRMLVFARQSELPEANFMSLNVRYDDGFVAYLNGEKILSVNAPDNPQWNSAATADNADASAVNFQRFNVSEFVGLLRGGANQLALHGLNRQLSSSDFLLDVQMEVGALQEGLTSPTAQAYEGAIPITVPTRIRARSLSEGRWSAMREGVFYPGELVDALRIGEIMYRPPGGNAFEFFEVTNFGPAALDLSNNRTRGVSFSFPPETWLAAGDTFLLASGQDPGAFAQRYPDVEVDGFFGGSLANGGETLAVVDAEGNVRTAVRYGDAGLWPEAADGQGASLELIDPARESGSASNWVASSVPGGSPGSITVPETQSTLIISEVMAANVTAVPFATETFGDWIELENRGPAAVSLEGYQLRDSGGNEAYEFEAGSVLAPGQRWVVRQADPAVQVLGFPFGLNREGDGLVLYDAANRRIDAVAFGLQAVDYSLVRTADDEWTLGLPSPGEENQAAALADLSVLRINEIMANPLPGRPDWVELFNGDSDQPVALEGLHLRLNDHIVRFSEPAFLPPGGQAFWQANESASPGTLGFRLPAAGASLALLGPLGEVYDELRYAAQSEGRSWGRLPNGEGLFQEFRDNVSPGLLNYAPITRTVRLNEIMARNQTSLYFGVEGNPDWIELYNQSNTAVDLTGAEVRISGADDWQFPDGTMIGAEGYLLIWCDDEGLFERSTAGGLLIPSRLRGRAGSVQLLDSQGRLMDVLDYGPQIPDQALGVVGDDWRLVNRETPGGPNRPGLEMGSVQSLRLNEWSVTDGDWIELYNGDERPVLLSGLFLTDDPSQAGATKHEIAPYSFVGGGSWVVFEADDRTDAGAHHLPFQLKVSGETVRLYSAQQRLLDEIGLALQPESSASAGLLPDGADAVVAFSIGEASPGAGNAVPIPGLRWNEVLRSAELPKEGAVELFNAGAEPLDVSGWFLSARGSDLRQFALPAGSRIPAGGFLTVFQGAWPGMRDAEELHFSESDSSGALTGRRIQLDLEAAAFGQSIGGIATGGGLDFGRLSVSTFGADSATTIAGFRAGQGAVNADAYVGPLVVERILPRSAVPAWEGEFVELVNRSSGTLALSDEAAVDQAWRVSGGVDYSFGGTLALGAGERLVLVDFDPQLEPDRVAALRSIYSVADSTRVLGPYSGRLDNQDESLRIEQLVRISEGPGAGRLVWLLEDRVQYTNAAPWPERDSGQLLVRSQLGAYGNDPANWEAVVPAGGVLGEGELEITAIEVTATTVRVEFVVGDAGAYRLEARAEVSGGPWLPVASVADASGVVILEDPAPATGQRFYRVVEE